MKDLSKKEMLTITFSLKEFNATDIETLVNLEEFRKSFKDMAFMDPSDFILDNLTQSEKEMIDLNMKKINIYYKMGLIRHYLYPPKLTPFSKKAFEETGHNQKNVKPIKGLGMEFVFGSKRFIKPSLK